ncbi:Nif3-like dinuclear metal center hexameric protein [Bacillus sp. PK3-056]|uniref:hypothetical protein n=1 Tax=Niallia circulans TaxID=1397 RepID=UPI0019CF8EFD|nr:hypothetical protein [Niallia circulans]
MQCKDRYDAEVHTIQYAEFKGINLIIGSHTFTKFFGIQSLALKWNERIKELKVVRLSKEHYEATINKGGLKSNVDNWIL